MALPPQAPVDRSAGGKNGAGLLAMLAVSILSTVFGAHLVHPAHPKRIRPGRPPRRWSVYGRYRARATRRPRTSPSEISADTVDLILRLWKDLFGQARTPDRTPSPGTAAYMRRHPPTATLG